MCLDVVKLNCLITCRYDASACNLSRIFLSIVIGAPGEDWCWLVVRLGLVAVGVFARRMQVAQDAHDGGSMRNESNDDDDDGTRVLYVCLCDSFFCCCARGRCPNAVCVCVFSIWLFSECSR